MARYLSTYDPSKIRNVAIIAHVDHGKTTLMDKLLAACSPEEDKGKLSERAMDSNEHEKERGITITSKYTRLYYGEHVLHVVDTPGHADFGGEVERILSMVEGVVLLVDASEGPMSQTKFVLSKALGANKPAIVVLNKVDREGHRADEVESEIFDLFCALSSKDELLEYPLLYASAKNGWATESLDDIPGKDGVEPLLRAIIEHIPAPTVKQTGAADFALAVNTIQSDNHLGRIVTGKVESGSVKIGDRIRVLASDGTAQGGDEKVTKLFYLEGLTRRDVTEANAGEIVSLAGCGAGVSDTVCAPGVTQAVHTPSISPPVISMTFGPNDSPMAGKEGSKLTSNMIKDRLKKEIENNVTLQLSPANDAESINVQGRGELQIGILVEALRREGFEMTVSPPSVLGRRDEETGKNIEPYVLCY
jgi:GTP-binding protein